MHTTILQQPTRSLGFSNRSYNIKRSLFSFIQGIVRVNFVSIVRGVILFFLAMVLMIAILVAFLDVALYLPSAVA